MIGSISSSQVSNGISGYNVNDVISGLTSDDYSTIKSVLSNYDSSNLTQDDALEITSAFKDANIEPTKQLSNFLDTLGFDAKEIGDLANVSAQNPRSIFPSQNFEELRKEEEGINSILQKLIGDDESSENDSIFNEILDYSTKITGLNDKAKESVFQLLENYSPENTSLSKDDTKNIVQNSLNQILSDSNNYDISFSIYA